MARRIKTFREEEGMILKRSPTGRTPTVTTDEKRRILKLPVQQSPKPQQSPRF